MGNFTFPNVKLSCYMHLQTDRYLQLQDLLHSFFASTTHVGYVDFRPNGSKHLAHFNLQQE